VISRNLASLLPDWNSLDSVRNAHSHLELWAIWLFVILVVCDVVAHFIEDDRKELAKRFVRFGLLCFALALVAELFAYRYGQRSDELSAGVISSLSQKASAALCDAKAAHDLAQSASTIAKPAKETADKAKVEADAVAKEAEHIDAGLTFAQRMVGARHVLNESDLENRLSKGFKGKFIIFKSYVLDPEAFALCKQLVTVAMKPEAGVIAKDECADEPLPPHLQESELLVTAPTIEEAQRLGMAVSAPGVVAFSVGLGLTPELTVLVGKQASQPLFWPKATEGSSKKNKNDTSAKP
jgi:hypothetical protein